jgi:hypothetical protein
VPRPQLIQLFPQINDRQFASVLQYYLKKFDELDKLHIKIRWNRPIIVKQDGDWDLALTLLTDVPMPLHIKNFQEIQIRLGFFQEKNCTIPLISLSYFDRSVLGFLQEFHHNYLFTNVNLKMSTKDITSPENQLEFLTHFLPLMTNINSIELLAPSLYYLDLIQNECSELLMPMLASAQVLVTKLVFYFPFPNSKLIIHSAIHSAAIAGIPAIAGMIGFAVGFTHQGQMGAHEF